MSPFDCHVNRSPVDGTVKKITYKKGKFLPAFKKSSLSERNEIIIHSEDGEFTVTQIAGFFARRIVCYVEEGERVRKGQRIGMIRFGSRVVLEIPENYRILRKEGEKVKAGETIAERR
jgi:phosphatidylserine decarboxylase